MPPIFLCENCDFRCSKKSNYDKHLATRKHLETFWKHLETTKKCRFSTSIDEGNSDEKMPEKCAKKMPKKCRFLTSIDEGGIFEKMPKNDSEKMPKKCRFLTSADEDATSAPSVPPYVCRECKKTYKYRSGLWKHQTKCINESTTQNMGTLIHELLKQNQEIKELLVEQMNRPTVIQHTTHNHYNLNVFLNERCKNALNISEFVEKLQIQFEDLEYVGKLGFVEGISRIIVNELNQLEVHERPIHCTDMKRDVVYIKDQDQWNRDTEMKKMMDVIETVANKNMKMIPQWYKNHPEASELDSDLYKQHMSIMIESIGGLGGSNENVKTKQQSKIIKSVLKNVYLEKDKHLKIT